MAAEFNNIDSIRRAAICEFVVLTQCMRKREQLADPKASLCTSLSILGARHKSISNNTKGNVRMCVSTAAWAK